MKKLKANIKFFPITLILSCIVLLSSFLYSCQDKLQQNKSDVEIYKSKIDLLQNQISKMKDNQKSIESVYKEKIEDIESDLTELEKIKVKELETKKEPEMEKKEFFGFIYEETKLGATIVAYKGNSNDVIIPASINGIKVNKIANCAFEKSNVRSFSIPETVEYIGWFAFKDCKNLKMVVIPSSVSEIGYQAFDGCSSLTIYAKKDTYAYKYAESYGIKLSTT